MSAACGTATRWLARKIVSQDRNGCQLHLNTYKGGREGVGEGEGEGEGVGEGEGEGGHMHVPHKARIL